MPSPSSVAGGGSRAATRLARRVPAPGLTSPRSATSPGARSPDPFAACRVVRWRPRGGGMADPVGDIIGDYRAFAAQQHASLLARRIDIRPYPLSHLAFRVPEWDQYVHVRTL